MVKIWIVRILQGILSAGFVMAGMSKFFMGTEALEEAYIEPYGYSEGFMYMIGGIELLAAVCLIIGFWKPVSAVLGAAALTVVMTGAVISILLSDEKIVTAVSPFAWVVVSIIVILGRRNSVLQQLKKPRTT